MILLRTTLKSTEKLTGTNFEVLGSMCNKYMAPGVVTEIHEWIAATNHFLSYRPDRVFIYQLLRCSDTCDENDRLGNCSWKSDSGEYLELGKLARQNRGNSSGSYM